MMDERRTTATPNGRDSTRDTGRGDGRGSGMAAWLIILLLVAFIGGMLLSPWFENEVRPRLPFITAERAEDALTARLDQQERAIELLEGRIAAVEQRPEAPSLPSVIADTNEQPALNDPVPAEAAAELATGQLAGLSTRVDALDRQQTQIGSRVDNLSAEVAGLTVRVQDTRGEAAGQVERAERLAREARSVILVAQARRAFEQGQPLGPVEPALRTALGPDSSEQIDRLVAGMRGLVRPPALADRFARLAPQLIDPARGQAGEESWWSSFTSGVASIFEVRRAQDEPNAERTEDVVARVETLIRAGNVDGALAAFRSLPDAVQQRGQRWARDAQRYLQTESVLAQLEAQVVGEGSAAAPEPAQPQGTTQL